MQWSSVKQLTLPSSFWSKSLSSLATSKSYSESLLLMDESSLTSTLCTSRARMGAPRHTSAATVNWISLLLSQWRTNELELSVEMENDPREDRRGMSFWGSTTAAMWNFSEDSSWYLTKGSEVLLCSWWRWHLPDLTEMLDGSWCSPCLIVSHQMRQILSAHEVRRTLTTEEL